jgi:transcriptional regulator with XRE-family HTH domain
MGKAIDKSAKQEVLDRRKRGGQWLKTLREDAGLTQQKIAEQLNIDYYTFIAQIENGRVKLPNRLIGGYAKALGVPHDLFMAHCLYFFHDPGMWRNSDFVKKHVPGPT